MKTYRHSYYRRTAAYDVDTGPTYSPANCCIPQCMHGWLQYSWPFFRLRSHNAERYAKLHQKIQRHTSCGVDKITENWERWKRNWKNVRLSSVANMFTDISIILVVQERHRWRHTLGTDWQIVTAGVSWTMYYTGTHLHARSSQVAPTLM